ncbi:MAG: VWA domain-containing protein [Acidobacteriota bacterium]
MSRKAIAVLALLSLTLTVYPQKKEQRPVDEKPIRISTQLVQWDVVVTDKDGRVVEGLTRDDFELYEEGRKQVVSFFEFVDAVKGRRQEDPKASDTARPADKGEDIAEADVKRIIAFVVDDLTIRLEDLVNVRGMLTRFVNEQMTDNDLVAIVRAVGGKGLTQQLTSNKQLLHRAIASLTVTTHPLSSTNPSPSADMSGRETRVIGTPTPLGDTEADIEDLESNLLDNNVRDFANNVDDTVKVTRALMTLGTASFIIESLKQLPGRKSLVLVSGGMPVLSTDTSTSGIDITSLINRLTDRATRAGVAVHTMDVRGLIADVARFTDTPGKSAIPTDLGTLNSSMSNVRPPSTRGPNEKLFGPSTVEDQLGLRALASGTGGIAVLNKNDFSSGLDKIITASQGYYILAYTPTDANFDGKFRKIEVKLKRGGGYRLYARKGYIAKDDAPALSAPTKRDQLLAIIRSPLAQRDVKVQAMLIYKAVPPKQGAIDINLLIDPRTLSFDEADGKHQTSFDVAGFVFDEFGEVRGGFNETINANLTPEEFSRVSRGGLTYSANTTLPSGAYQIRLAVRDNKTGNAGTLSRYVEVPDLTKGRFAASSLLLFAARPGDTRTTDTMAIGADRQISRSRDLRYVVAIYNAKLKGGKPLVRAQMSISQNGKTLYTDPDETVQSSGDQMIKMGQLGFTHVKPGRYRITLTITDPLADKKWQTLTRIADFILVD